jgi:uncharacterized membrane protein (UPF0127 family)
VRGLGLAAAAALAACSPGPAPSELVRNEPAIGQPQMGLEKVPLTVITETGAHRFTVEVARTEEQQRLGLMFRTALGPNEGMIFPYQPPQDVSFWMQNTLIPLDIIFVRANGMIARITTAAPHSLAPVPSGEAIALVLEIPGGRAAELGIRPGDKVEW